MTDANVVTSSTSGVFTAKIQKEDFIANEVSVFFDGEYWHCYGAEKTASFGDHRTIYIHVKQLQPDDLPTFHKLTYRSLSGDVLERASADAGTVTIDFSPTAGRYRMSFDVKAKDLSNLDIDILGEFDLVTQ